MSTGLISHRCWGCVARLAKVLCCHAWFPQVWAFLEYMDDVLGRLFDYMDASPLKANTYVMLMSDNGAELFPGERRGNDKLVRYQAAFNNADIITADISAHCRALRTMSRLYLQYALMTKR